MDRIKIGVGALLLVVSTVVLFATGTLNSPVPVVVGGAATLGLAAGTLLIGTSDADGRPV